jgi:hypothetical protein
MRLGGPVSNYKNPEEWIETLKQWGYGAAYCPVDNNASEELIKSYVEEASKANIVIAEVGAWSSPVSLNEKMRKEAIEHCQKAASAGGQIGCSLLCKYRRFAR